MLQNNKPGNSFQKPFGIGSLNGQKNQSGVLTQKDRNDFYRFSLSGRSSVSLNLKGLKANADLEIYNSNRARIATSRQGGMKAEQINTTLEAGTYHVKVAGKGGKTGYKLNMSGVLAPIPPVPPPPNPGVPNPPSTPGMPSPPPVPQPAAQKRFRVSVSGFTVNNETIDDGTEFDGARDEVFIAGQTRVHGKDGTVLSSSDVQKSRIMGSPLTPDRVQAGSARGSHIYNFWRQGGLQTGDSFPSSTPWQRSGELKDNEVPMKLWEGDLVQGENLALVTPTVWEHDPQNLWNSIKKPIENWLPGWAKETIQLTNEIANALFSGGGSNVPVGSDQSSLFKSGRQLFGDSALGAEVIVRGGGSQDAKDRPIGMIDRGGKNYIFDPKVLPLTYDLANVLSQTDVSGKGKGVVALRYKDDPSASDLKGDYTMYLKIEQV
jgi:hypothetical protein